MKYQTETGSPFKFSGMGLHETLSELQYTSVHAQGRETTSRSQEAQYIPKNVFVETNSNYSLACSLSLFSNSLFPVTYRSHF